MAASKSRRYETKGTAFDKFAGVYHAFEQLVSHVDTAIATGEERAALSRLFGAKYDSLPVLLQKTFDRKDEDSVMRYITFLCAQQTVERVRGAHPEFMEDHRVDAAALDALLIKLPELRGALDVAGEDSVKFIDWYEEMFLRRIESDTGGEE